MSNRYRRAFPVDPELAESVAESMRNNTRKMIKEVFPNLQTTVNDDAPVCLRCGKKLKSPTSRKQGYGPTCFRKHLEENQKYRERRLF